MRGRLILKIKYCNNCSKDFIIEFTFDSTSGVSNIIKRFELLKEVVRTRIAFVPNKNVGKKRRNKLNDLKVIIRNSDDFNYLLDGGSSNAH